MLEEVLNKYFNKKNLKHAYLLETSDFNKVLTVAKKILLDSNEATYNLENLIDNDIYSDLKIITPEGQWIKKEQIIMLKDEFKVKSSYNNKRIYIIKNAEHLNKSSANTMLKFLEEPEENIVALLVTTNKTKVLQTIASRCQYIILDSNKDRDQTYSLDGVNLYSVLETKKQNAGFDIIKMFDNYDDRNMIKNLLNELIFIYEQLLLKKINIQNSIEDNEIFDKTIKNITIEDIQKRINAIIIIIDSLEYNVNLKLLVDKLVISMFGVD